MEGQRQRHLSGFRVPFGSFRSPRGAVFLWEASWQDPVFLYRLTAASRLGSQAPSPSLYEWGPCVTGLKSHTQPWFWSPALSPQLCSSSSSALNCAQDVTSAKSSGVGAWGAEGGACLRFVSAPDLTEDGGLVTSVSPTYAGPRTGCKAGVQPTQPKKGASVWPNHIPPGREMLAQSFPFLFLRVRSSLWAGTESTVVSAPPFCPSS